MRLTIRIMLTVVLIFLGTTVRADEFEDYARQMREEIWNWDRPEFSNYSVPDEYKNESAVILARHQEIEVRSKRIVQLVRLYYTEIDRRMVKINDNVSLEYYSDLSFAERQKLRSSTYGGKNLIRTVLGVRIIKPDGTIQNVDVDEAVQIDDEKNKKLTRRKLAIPGLQVGDILDYFYCENITVDEYNVPPVWFALYSIHPTLHYSARCVVNTKRLNVEYAALNGAPDFTRTPLSDEETELELSATNLPKVAEGRYISYLRDTPIVRMYILNNKNIWTYAGRDARKPGLYKVGDNLSKIDVLYDAAHRSVQSTYYSDYAKPFLKERKKFLKKHFEANPGMSNLEKTNYIYDYLHIEWPQYNDVYNQHAFLCLMHNLLMEYAVPHEHVLMTDIEGPRMGDILTASDLFDAIRVEGKYYTYPYGMRVAGWLYPDNQGQEAYVMDRWTLQNGKVKYDKEYKSEYIVTPTTTAAENRSLQRLDIRLGDSNPLELVINRDVLRSGALKGYYQNLFNSYEQWDTTVRKYLPISMTYWEMLKKDKWSNKQIEDRRAVFERRRESFNDSVKVEINSFHDADAKEVMGYHIKTLGVVPAEPDFTYDVNYTIEGFVKRAGNNWIVDAGKLIGQQWEPTPDDRQRTVDAHIATPRIFENEFTLHIPDGYQAVEADKLNMELDNAYATFRAVATIEGNTLVVKTYKEYKQRHIPADKWAEFMAVMDQAVKFQGLSVVLRKK